MNKFLPKNKKGVTLIELIFSLALFSIAILVVLTLLSMGITGQRKVLALQNVQENARFVLEFMAKELRMSVIMSNPNSSEIQIRRPGGNIIEYTFNAGNIERMNLTLNQGGVINSSSVIISGGFYVSGIGNTDGLQPRVTISISVQGKGTKIEQQASIDLQTTLSQRTLDVP